MSRYQYQLQVLVMHNFFDIFLAYQAFLNLILG